ncbi:helix-turn-helix domain-containing protein [Carnimonas bestiolae]|uniref:helix-turn-helix domain-containing protein n=1 Tax=Carnimonas bestiolae TaxID=3402172 RepID=UPI003EDB8A01
MDDDTNDVYERIADAARRYHKLPSKRGTNARIAKDLQLTTAAISRWASKKSLPSAENIDRLAELYGVSPEYLAGVSEIEGRPYQLDSIEKMATSVLWKVAIYAKDMPSADRAAELFELAVEILRAGGAESDAVGRLLQEVSR